MSICLSESVRGSQPAVTEVVPRREETQHQTVLQLGVDTHHLARVSLAGSLGSLTTQSSTPAQRSEVSLDSRINIQDIWIYRWVPWVGS